MRAQEYLKARDIDTVKLENVSVGRLSIDAEFKISSKRGVIVSPKRGTISDRYLSLLSENGVSLVVAEGGSSLSFYEALQKERELVPIRALRPLKARLFPTLEVFEHLAALLRYVVKKRESINQIASNIVAVRISDEKNSNMADWESSIAGSVEDCTSLLNRITGQVKHTDVYGEEILKTCAIIAGFRITPESRKESALLLDWFAQLSNGRNTIHGLPLALSPIFRTIGKISKTVSIVTSAIGSQFSALSGQSNDLIILENGSHDGLSILQTIYPNARFTTGNYLDSKTKESSDTVILIPPFGKSFSAKLETKLTGSFFGNKASNRKVPVEYLYVFKAIEQCKSNGTIVAVVQEGLLSGANHAEFRNWLLDNVQILGVVSLPSGFCFAGTAVRSSILFLKKTTELPVDYSISMMELHPQDFEDKVAGDTVRAVQGILVPEDHS